MKRFAAGSLLVALAMASMTAMSGPLSTEAGESIASAINALFNPSSNNNSSIPDTTKNSLPTDEPDIVTGIDMRIAQPEPTNPEDGLVLADFGSAPDLQQSNADSIALSIASTPQITSVPAPGSLALLTCGLSILGFVALRRKPKTSG